jgi:hypothetical protein
MRVSGSLAFALYGYEVDVITKLLAVQCFLVVVHDIGQVGVARDLRQNALLLSLLQVVLGAVVLVLGQDLLLHAFVLGLLALLLAVGLLGLLHREEGRAELFVIKRP